MFCDTYISINIVVLFYRDTIREREAEMRSKVTAIHELDVTAEYPLTALQEPDKYDIMVSSCCFECASRTLDGYRTAVRNMTSLLSPGGYFIVVGELGASFYKVGNYRFPSVTINRDQVHRIFSDAGYDIIKFSEMVPPVPGGDPTTDFYSMFVMLARKKQ